MLCAVTKSKDPLAHNSLNTSMKKADKRPWYVDFIRTFSFDVYEYCRLLGFEPNWQQKELLDAYQAAITGVGKPKIACRAGKGPGKSKATAVIFTHWSLVHPKSRLVVTAPTFKQCQDVWLAEAYDTITGLKADPRISELFDFRGRGYGILGAKNRDWGCVLQTAIKKEAFQGQHRKYLAFLEEEASGVASEISGAISETLSNAKGTWLHVRIGNPNSRTCVFFDCFHKEREQWECLHWNTEETPETPYFSKRRNDEIAKEYGKNSDVYRISVLGEFPDIDPDCIVSEEELDACCTQETLNNVIKNNPDQTKQIGIDLARYGGDECVVVWRQGGILWNMWADKTDPNNAIDKAIAGQYDYNWKDSDCMYVIDTSGIGEAVVGVVGGSKYMNKKVHEFYSQNCAHENHKYTNKITEAWWLFRNLVRKRLIYLGESMDVKLKRQLITRRYIVDRKTGRLMVESKDDYAKNNKDSENGTIGKSPDRADAIVMAFYKYAKQSTRVAASR